MKIIISLLIFISFDIALSQSWHPVPTSIDFISRCDDLTFKDGIGWAVSSNINNIYKSTDNGITWYESGILDGYLRSVEFLSKDIGFVGAFKRGIYRTSDSGMSWDSVLIQHNSFRGICGMDILEDSTIFAVGTYYFSALILRSKDLGLNWEITDLSDEISGLVDVKFYDNRVGLAVGSSDSGGVVYRTTDGGDNWKMVYKTGVPEELGWKIDFTLDTGFTFVSVQNLVGDSTSILKSSDKGETWQEIRHIYYPIQGICFWDEMNGAIGGWNLPIYETTDGGKTWSEISLGTANINRFVKMKDYTLAAGVVIFKKENFPSYIENPIPDREKKLRY